MAQPPAVQHSHQQYNTATSSTTQPPAVQHSSATTTVQHLVASTVQHSTAGKPYLPSSGLLYFYVLPTEAQQLLHLEHVATAGVRTAVQHHLRVLADVLVKRLGHLQLANHTGYEASTGRQHAELRNAEDATHTGSHVTLQCSWHKLQAGLSHQQRCTSAFLCLPHLQRRLHSLLLAQEQQAQGQHQELCPATGQLSLAPGGQPPTADRQGNVKSDL